MRVLVVIEATLASLSLQTFNPERQQPIGERPLDGMNHSHLLLVASLLPSRFFRVSMYLN